MQAVRTWPLDFASLISPSCSIERTRQFSINREGFARISYIDLVAIES
jgi:hypothetical protein